MKPKPKPKKELIVNALTSNSEIIRLTCSSFDAKEFVLNEAKKYGRLMPESETVYMLSVGEEWDAHEVVEYLKSYND